MSDRDVRDNGQCDDGRRSTPGQSALRLALCAVLSVGAVQAQDVPAGNVQARLQQMEARIAAQDARIEVLQARVQHQQDQLAAMQGGIGEPDLETLRARGVADVVPGGNAADAMIASASGAAEPQAAQPGPVGRPPEGADRPPEIARIFEQPGVLTPKGRLVVEPSLQFGYSSNDRVALVGYTVIPAILIGLIDVRQVKTTSMTAAIAARYGISRRLELEARVPFSSITSDTVSREIFTGSAQDKVFNADGSGVGDVEVTARYQINQGAIDKPFYVGWLRYKSRTGRDLFEVVTDCVTRCVANATGTGLPLELPTGSGFAALQTGVTWLYASDPVVFFGSLSYLHNFARDNVERTVLTGAPEGFPQTTTEPIGKLEAGDIIGLNFGMGLALNERAAVSFGYDQSSVARTQQNGIDAPGAVRVMLGTMVVGGSYRINDAASLNVSLGVGVTRDTPDVSFAVRVPITF